MTHFELAMRFVGEVHEIPGEQHSPFIQWCLECCGYGPEAPDEIPWCAAFVSRICWICRLPRSKSAAARSWLQVGTAKALPDAFIGDIVVLKRGQGAGQSGPDVLQAPGHVGFYAGREAGRVLILSGNQSDAVTVARFSVKDILGIRRVVLSI